MSTYANQYMGTSNENDIDPSIINLNRVAMQVWMEKNCPEMIPTKTVEVEKEISVKVPVEVTKEISVEVPVKITKEISVEVPVEVIKEVEVTKEISVEIPVETIKEISVEVPRYISVEVTSDIEQMKIELLSSILDKMEYLSSSNFGMVEINRNLSNIIFQNDNPKPIPIYYA